MFDSFWLHCFVETVQCKILCMGTGLLLSILSRFFHEIIIFFNKIAACLSKMVLHCSINGTGKTFSLWK